MQFESSVSFGPESCFRRPADAGKKFLWTSCSFFPLASRKAIGEHQVECFAISSWAEWKVNFRCVQYGMIRKVRIKSPRLFLNGEGDIVHLPFVDILNRENTSG